MLAPAPLSLAARTAISLAAAVALAACGASVEPGVADGPEETTPPARTDPPPPSVGGLAASETDVEGVVADLLEAERADGRLTVAIRFRNTAPGPRRIEIAGVDERGWRLVAGDRAWPLAVDPDGDPAATDPPRRTLEPGQTALWRGVFVAPPPEVETFRLEVPGVRPFDRVPIVDE